MGLGTGGLLDLHRVAREWGTKTQRQRLCKRDKGICTKIVLTSQSVSSTRCPASCAIRPCELPVCMAYRWCEMPQPCTQRSTPAAHVVRRGIGEAVAAAQMETEEILCTEAHNLTALLAPTLVAGVVPGSHPLRRSWTPLTRAP